MSIQQLFLGTAAGGGEAGYQVANSLRFNDDDTANLNKTPSGAGNRKTWTYSAWVKRSELEATNTLISSTGGGIDDSGYLTFGFRSTDILQIGGALTWWLQTNQVFRDTSTWQHIVCAVNTTISAPNEDDRIKLYVNGSQITSFAARSNPAQNLDLAIHQPYTNYIGTEGASANCFDGYMADIHMVDGLQLDASSFGETDATTGQWVPKEYTHVAATDAYHTLNDGTTWSDNVTGGRANQPATNIFDGDITTYAQNTSGGPNPNTMPITFPSLSYIDKVEVLPNNVTSCAINGGSQTAVTNGTWNTMATGGGTLTNLTFSRNHTNGCAVFAIRVDGIILVDNAADNSFHLAMDPTETGTNYSGTNVEAVGGSMQNGGTPYITDMSPADAEFQYYTNTKGAYNIFNGLISGSAAANVYLYDNNETTVWTLDLRDEGTVTSVKVYGCGGDSYGNTAAGDNWVCSLLDANKSAISNTSVTLTSATYAWFTVPVAGTPKYLKFTQTTGMGPLWLAAIQVNGKALINHTAIGYDSSGLKNHWHENNLQIVAGPNDGTIWSDDASSNGGNHSNTTKLNAFNGDVSTYWQSADNVTQTYTFSSLSSGLLEAYVYGTHSQYTINVDGSNLANPTANGKWVTLSSDASTVSTVTFLRSGSKVAIGGFRVGGDAYGTVLVDGQNGAAGIDFLADSPSTYDDGGNGVGNYATLSPLVAQTSGGNTLSNGNLTVTNNGTRTASMSDWALTGKTYWEVKFDGSGDHRYFGMTRSDGFNTVANNNSGLKYVGYQDYSWGWGGNDGNLYNASNIEASPGTYANGDIMGWAFDADALTIKCYKNGSLEHTETGIASGTYFPAISLSNNNATADLNFGARSFAYTPPTGYKALNTFNAN